MHIESSEMGEASEKWIKHYSSEQQILLVGEGDFSFALSLATAFGSATNITATSLDTPEELGRKYGRALENVEELRALGCTIKHGVDVRTMSRDHTDLCSERYDRIVFNFPHAGFIYREHDSSMIMLHQEVVRGFLRNAREMMKEDGEIHVSHKTAYPFSGWGIETLAKQVNLRLAEEVPFRLWDYSGYLNKRGSGSNSDSTFPVGSCSTFKFKK